MIDQDTVYQALVGGFLLFVIIPLGLRTLGFLISPDANLEDGIELLTSAVVPWWTGIAVTAPVLFVAFLLVVSWAGADEIL